MGRFVVVDLNPRSDLRSCPTAKPSEGIHRWFHLTLLLLYSISVETIVIKQVNGIHLAADRVLVQYLSQHWKPAMRDG